MLRFGFIVSNFELAEAEASPQALVTIPDFEQNKQQEQNRQVPVQFFNDDREHILRNHDVVELRIRNVEHPEHVQAKRGHDPIDIDRQVVQR